MFALENWGRKWAEAEARARPSGRGALGVGELLPGPRPTPRRRVLIRFEYPTLPGSGRASWLLIERGDAEYCLKYPGGEEELIVVVNDPLAFARWHHGTDRWGAALRSGRSKSRGASCIGEALPTWNRRAWAADDPRARYDGSIQHQPAPAPAATST